MSESVEIVSIGDKDYMVTAEIVINNVTYVYLTNENDIADFCIRKINKINNNEYLVGLNDGSEVKMALKEFANKLKNE